jgi:Cu+-exporting ATPase
MRLADILVLAVSAGFLLLFYGWFFGSKRRVGVTAATVSGVQEVEIEVKGGYTPDHIVVTRGRPVRLKFRRTEGGPCTDHVLIPGLRVNLALPAFRTTDVEFTPTEAGDFEFHCGMNMVHGTMTVT